MAELDLEALRLAIYRTFAREGRQPDREALAEDFGTTLDAVEAGYRDLASVRHLVLDESGDIVMAHPFSSVPLGFSVMGRDTLWWGGCAWDSFALPHLLLDEPTVLVATTCPGCGAALAWNVTAEEPPAGDQIAHFLVPVERIWDDVVHTCGHQRLFCSRDCVEMWLASSGNDEGYVMDLAQLWRLASGWYAGRLDPGYIRREPSEAKEYFRSVGLTGRFWGL
jgi:hypothetical protein